MFMRSIDGCEMTQITWFISHAFVHEWRDYDLDVDFVLDVNTDPIARFHITQ